MKRSLDTSKSRRHCLGLWLVCLSSRTNSGWALSQQHSPNSSRAAFLQSALQRAPVVAVASLAGLSMNDPSHISTWTAFASDSSLAQPSTTSLIELQSTLQRAVDQLQPVPTLIQQEKWDAVRAILIQPPISECWAKTATNNARALLPSYAAAVGDAGGDELAALELKEDIVSHLRYLDMAVYNNVFNPIGTEGTTGATKELVRSYYEDPTNEYQASIAALRDLVSLADGL